MTGEAPARIELIRKRLEVGDPETVAKLKLARSLIWLPILGFYLLMAAIYRRFGDSNELLGSGILFVVFLAMTPIFRWWQINHLDEQTRLIYREALRLDRRRRLWISISTFGIGALFFVIELMSLSPIRKPALQRESLGLFRSSD